jgi:hypothetical protein
MESEHLKEREPRFPIEAATSVETCKNNQTSSATTMNMSGSGVLLHFEGPIQLAVGDHVSCEFKISHDADKSLPYWGVGSVVRIQGDLVAIEFKGVGFTQLKPESDGTTALKPEPDPLLPVACTGQ